ncbi:PREDICTED: probable phospholipid-transporting ATPase IF [Dinoponera quadriceps]|uniref:Phospholipid-transporting ATPase n=1 Tax=Dinoponera quadriceps TaxID=609295 RepID=A0A6P3WWJ4_DINQU|nr:PREDICTED: probable phospholipid-transporting ATPase IF [Dinoponera quadriceps]
MVAIGTTTSALGEHRVVKINSTNNPLETPFVNNRIVSNKYTLWNFVPKNLFEQFRRIANFYFLLTLIVALSIDSPISPLTSALPLTFVILVTAGKQGYEDYLRYKMDQRDNRRSVTVIRNKCLQDIYCEKILVGDLVKVSRDEDVPCDIVLLYSETPGCCYVTTSNLDGETNLKTLQIPRVVSKMARDEIVGAEATITCQHPLADLYTFFGKLEVNNGNEITSGHLTIDNIMLRGSRLKDTDYVIGCAIYTGQDTKLSLNSKIVSNKFSTVEKSINKYIIVFIIILCIEVLMSTLLKLYVETHATWDIYFGSNYKIDFGQLLTDILSFTILFNYIVPISLYVTVELQKFLGSLYFGWDIDMYDRDKDQPSLANTSDLSEELGQIEYLFTDKTGTLTENLMVFRRCSIDGNVYMEKDCDGSLYLLPQNGNEEEAVKIATWQAEIWRFMISISLCHVVHIAPPSQRPVIMARRTIYRESFRSKKITRVNSSLLMHPDLPEYQAASADEKALVEASARCGIIFNKDTNEEMELKIHGKVLVFEKLEILEFNSERKRMSVIVKDADGDIWLYCKGADSAVFPLIVQGRVQEATTHVADFSMRGLRTLVIAYKKMDQLEYERLLEDVEQARQMIGNERRAHITRAYDRMESGLTLLGVTAVEDCLQDNVQETLESLRVAGIKVWVLTGDKAETAENIALLCGHFKKGTDVLRLMGKTTEQSCFETLASFERKVNQDPHKQYGLLLDGTSMATTLQNCPDLLKTVGMACEAVVCCRLTPLQKSEIVRLIKNARSRPHTAAIGDGGNDVSMIQEAHVGIGILGREGRQASMSADFAFSKFMFLKKALLVHGHWYYLRISILTQYFFYKNLAFITPQVLYGLHSGFSTQQLYDGMYLMCFNVLFTSIPVVMYGLSEQDYNAEQLMQYPYLYKLYGKNYLMTKGQFVTWVFLGLWHACVTYFVVYYLTYTNSAYLYDNTTVGQWTYSTIILHLIILVENIHILLRSSYWTIWFVLSVVLSELLFFLFSFCYSLVQRRYDGDMLWVYQNLLMSPSFWLITLFVIVVCLMPDYLLLTYNTYRPLKILRKNEEQPQPAASTNSSRNKCFEVIKYMRCLTEIVRCLLELFSRS